MGRGAVPFLVAQAGTQQAAVAHIDGDEQLFTIPGGHGALAQDAVLQIDIVVDGCKLFLGMESHALENHIHHSLPVQVREFLCDAHIMEVGVHQVPLHIGKGVGNGNSPFLQVLSGGLHVEIADFHA